MTITVAWLETFLGCEPPAVRALVESNAPHCDNGEDLVRAILDDIDTLRDRLPIVERRLTELL